MEVLQLIGSVVCFQIGADTGLYEVPKSSRSSIQSEETTQEHGAHHMRSTFGAIKMTALGRAHTSYLYVGNS